MMEIEKLKEIIEEQVTFTTFIDGFDDAIIGTGFAGRSEQTIVYDLNKVLEIIMETRQKDGLEALELFNGAIRDGYMGRNPPIFINDFRKMVDAEKFLNLKKDASADEFLR